MKGVCHPAVLLIHLVDAGHSTLGNGPNNLAMPVVNSILKFVSSVVIGDVHSLHEIAHHCETSFLTTIKTNYNTPSSMLTASFT